MHLDFSFFLGNVIMISLSHLYWQQEGVICVIEAFLDFIRDVEAGVLIFLICKILDSLSGNK